MRDCSYVVAGGCVVYGGIGVFVVVGVIDIVCAGSYR